MSTPFAENGKRMCEDRMKIEWGVCARCFFFLFKQKTIAQRNAANDKGETDEDKGTRRDGLRRDRGHNNLCVMDVRWVIF